MSHRLVFVVLFLLLLSLAIGGSSPRAWAGNGILGSAHDFSTETWNPTGQVCAVCHAPHQATTGVGAAAGLLWNHALSSANYDLYTSTSLSVPADQPGPMSVMCLACHDGTVALDAFSGMSGSVHMSGAANIGTDLRGTHPVGMRWTHEGAPTNCGSCHSMQPPFMVSRLPFYAGKVECASCHDPHDRTPWNPGGANMLRLPLAGSEICLHCHGK